MHGAEDTSGSEMETSQLLPSGEEDGETVVEWEREQAEADQTLNVGANLALENGMTGSGGDDVSDTADGLDESEHREAEDDTDSKAPS